MQGLSLRILVDWLKTDPATMITVSVCRYFKSYI